MSATKCLAFLETFEKDFDARSKQIPFPLTLCFTFERLSANECKVVINANWICREQEFSGNNVFEEIEQFSLGALAMMDSLIRIYEKAKQKGVEIKLTYICGLCQETCPPTYSETYRIDVGEYSNTMESYDPRIRLVELAAKEAPLLKE